MEIESNNQANPNARDAAAAETTTGEPASTPSGSNTRWFIIAVVSLLIVYPAARWALSRNATDAPPSSGAGKELQLSFQEYKAGRYTEAITAAKAAIAADPNSADAYNNLAVSHMGLGNVDEAIKAGEEAVRLRPTFQLAQNNLAWFRQEKSRAAAPPIPPAVAAKAAEALELSLQHAQAGRFQDCVDAATQATKLDPGSARAFGNIGICQASLKNWDEALRNTQEAIRLDPGYQLARNNLAWIKQQMAAKGK